MWSELERKTIHDAIDAAYERVRRLNISPDFVVKRLANEYPNLYLKTMKIEDELTPKVPFHKAMTMVANWEGTWRQIEMKLNRRKPHAKRK
jgi:hypothetical protein